MTKTITKSYTCGKISENSTSLDMSIGAEANASFAGIGAKVTTNLSTSNVSSETFSEEFEFSQTWNIPANG